MENRQQGEVHVSAHRLKTPLPAFKPWQCPDPTPGTSQDLNQTIILSQDLLHIRSVADQLQLLVSGLGPALHSVTYLALSFLTGAGDSTLQAFTNALGATVVPLGVKCPKVEKLRLDGDLGLAAITALGQAFPVLRQLELTTCSIPITTVVALNKIFPCLTHLTIEESHNSPFEVRATACTTSPAEQEFFKKSLRCVCPTIIYVICSGQQFINERTRAM